MMKASLWNVWKAGRIVLAMAKNPKSKDEERSPGETERIREATLKRLLNTPPKRHSEMVAERKAKRGAKGGRSRQK
jgi:hypothetical protein